MANEIITQGVEVGSFYDLDTGDVAQTNHILADTFVFRQRALENDEQDATGGRYYGGDVSELEYEFVDPDGSLYTQLKAWQEANKRVSFVGVGMNRHVQWYEKDRLSQVRKVDLQGSASEGRGDKVFVRMQREGHGSHDIHSDVNILNYRKWRGSDSDSNGFPDNYDDNGNWSNVQFADADGDGVKEQFTAYAPTDGSSAVLRANNIPFPISGIDLTQSVLMNQLHQDGTTKMQLIYKAFDGTNLNTHEETFASTGRKSTTGTTPGSVFYLQANVLVVTGASAQTQRAGMADPALRIDGSDTFVQY